jgi:hypothetical protein
MYGDDAQRREAVLISIKECSRREYFSAIVKNMRCAHMRSNLVNICPK